MQKKSLIKRLWNLFSINALRFMSSYCYVQFWRWKQLKGQYKGKRIFLIANGPSLNITPLYLLKNEYTIAFNRFTLMLERINYIPNFYMIADGLVASNIQDDIAYFIEKSEMIFVPDISKGDLVNFRNFVSDSKKVMYLFEEPIKFSNKMPFVSPGHTVIFRAFQVLKYLGFSEVVVVGNDMNYVLHKTTELLEEVRVKGVVNQSIKSKCDDDPNHFDPRYFGKGKEYHQPTDYVVNNIFVNLEQVATAYKKSGIKVVNAGYNSKVQSFEKQEFYECLGYSEKQIDDLFEGLLKSLGFESISDLQIKATMIDDIWDCELDIACVSISKAMSIVKKKVLDYLPIGPYHDYLYFINRKLINKN